MVWNEHVKQYSWNAVSKAVCIYSTVLERTTTAWGGGDIDRCPLEKKYEKGTEKQKNVKEKGKVAS
jgi:hypothetical protein